MTSTMMNSVLFDEPGDLAGSYDDEIVKVHVHTEDPGLVMQAYLKYGSLVKVSPAAHENEPRLVVPSCHGRR